MICFLLAKIRDTWTSLGPRSHSSLAFSTSLVFQCWSFQTTSTKNWHENINMQGGHRKKVSVFPKQGFWRLIYVNVRISHVMFGTTERLQSAGAQAIASGYSPPSGGEMPQRIRFLGCKNDPGYLWHISRWHKRMNFPVSIKSEKSCDFFGWGWFRSECGRYYLDVMYVHVQILAKSRFHEVSSWIISTSTKNWILLDISWVPNK